jgi:hypothetical protein
MLANGSTEMMRQIISMRYLVGFLGEKSQFGWWPTAFYEATSRQFLEPVFSKTSALAQYHGVVEAARRLHDEHLSVGSYHLFRLSEEIEQDLHEVVQTRSSELFESNLTDSTETALGALAKSGAGTGQEAVGPILVGKIEDLRNTAVLGSITEIYHAAYSSRTKAFPYMMK